MLLCSANIAYCLISSTCSTPCLVVLEGGGQVVIMDYKNIFGDPKLDSSDRNVIIRKLVDKVLCDKINGLDLHQISLFVLGRTSSNFRNFYFLYSTVYI